MKAYTVYFEAFGRKMKMEVVAENHKDAKEQVYEKIRFHQFKERPMTADEKDYADIYETIKDILK